MPLSLLEQVNKQISTVDSAAAAAISELENKWFPTDFEKSSASEIRGLKNSAIPAWAKLGRDAASADKLPGSNGWPGWLKAGEVFLQGIKDASDAADGAQLQAIIEVAKAAPAHVGEDITTAVRKTAKFSGEIVGTVGAAAGGAVGSTVAATLKPLWPVLLLVGAGAALYLGGVRKLGGGK